MAYETVAVEIKGNAAVLTLNRPEIRNALNFTMMADLPQALDELYSNKQVRTIVITGAGESFCSGADVKEAMGKQIEKPSMWNTSYGRQLKGEPNLISLAVKMRGTPIPIIAAVNGMAAGVGLSLALACDIRVASDKARFSMAFVKRGLIPDTGGTYFLPRLIGMGRASEMILTGDTIDAREAERIGLVNRIVPHDGLMKEVEELATRIAMNPPLAVHAGKRMVQLGMVAPDIAEHIAYESAVNRMLTETDDFKESVASFLEKRSAVYKGY